MLFSLDGAENRLFGPVSCRRLLVVAILDTWTLRGRSDLRGFSDVAGDT